MCVGGGGVGERKITGEGGCATGWTSTSLRSTYLRPLFCFGSSATLFLGLRGRFLAQKRIISETNNSKSMT